MNDRLVKKAVLRPCPICFSKAGEILHTQRFTLPKGYPLPVSYDVVSCAMCGFVYADSPAKQKDYDKYYQDFSMYEDTKISSGGGLMAWDKERSENVASEIVKALQDNDRSIIDIGCANGGILAALRSVGYNNLAGLDPSPACVKYIKKELGIKTAIMGGIFSQVLKDNESLRQSFDCGILSHVIEHIYDLKRAIENVSNLLKKGGILYIEVPDASRYLDYFTVPYHYFDVEHINHFDEHSIKNLLMLSGFDLVSVFKREINISRRIVYPVICAIGKKTGKEVVRRKPAADIAIKKSILEYISKSKKAEGSIRIKLEQLVKSQEPVIIWGMGSYAKSLLGKSLGKCNLVAFIDNDSKKWGSNIKGIVVSPPDQLKSLRGAVVICSALFSDDIYEQIKSMGIDNKVIVLK